MIQETGSEGCWDHPEDYEPVECDESDYDWFSIPSTIRCIKSDATFLYVGDSIEGKLSQMIVNLKAWSHECRIVPHRPTHEKQMTFNA